MQKKMKEGIKSVDFDNRILTLRLRKSIVRLR